MYFTMVKIRYQDYNNSLAENRVSIPTNKVNVFINIETALNYMSTVRDLENKLLVNRKYPDELKVDIINIAAHYKEFFTSNELDTKVFLYMTDLTSDMENGFIESEIFEDFRSYYLLKYRSNPKFISLGDKLVSEIIPDVKMLCEYIPNVYFISAKNIDSGLIPYMIGKSMPDRTNFVVSGDMSDSQYYFEPSFISHYYKRSVQRGRVLCATIEGYLKEITRSEKISPDIVNLFSSRGIYELLLAIKGDKYRSIPPIKGLSMATIIKCILAGIKENKITKEMENPMLLSSIFPKEIQGQLYANLMATDIRIRTEKLLDGKKKEILSQMVDQSDLNTLTKINQTRFERNPLTLEALLK